MIGRVHLQLNSELCGAPAYTDSKHTFVYPTYRPFEQLAHNITFIVSLNVWFGPEALTFRENTTLANWAHYLLVTQ